MAAKKKIKEKTFSILRSKKFKYTLGMAIIIGILKGFDAPDSVISIVKYAGTLLIAGHTITDVVAMIVNK